MKSWIAFPIERPIATLMVLVSLLVVGGVALARIPLGAWPLIERPAVRVEVPYSGGHPLETLRSIVMPLEEEIATVSGIKNLRSQAERNEAWIEAEFEWDDELDVKKLEVREAVERVRRDLPADVGYIRVESRYDGPGGGRGGAAGAVLNGRISAERDLSESWELLDRRIRRPLERIRGVAAVELSGVEPQQLRIDVDLDALVRHGVEARQLRARLDEENVDVDAGAVRGDVVRYNVRTMARFRDVASVRELEVRPGVKVGDVARVSLEEPRLDYGRHLNGRFAIGIEVYQEPQANTVEVVDRVMQRIREIQEDPELKGISLLVWDNAAQQIRTSLRGLRDSGLAGALLAVAVLYGFLRRLRTTLIVMMAIPFSLIVACGGLYFLGYELNILTMMGLMLGVGMLVDNAVVVIENIHRRESLGDDPREAARRGTREVFLAVVASTATTIIVWSWLFFADRDVMTIMMGACAAAICLAVFCSLIVSVTFIPLAAAQFTSRGPERPGFLIGRVVPGYRALLGWTLRHRFATLTALLALVASVWYPFSRIEKNFEPRSQDRAVSINYEIADPSTKEVLQEYVTQVETWLLDRRDELGFSDVYSFFSEEWRTLTQVYLPDGQASEESINALREKLRANLPVVPGVKLEVGDRMWWQRGGASGRRMVSVELAGEDAEYLEEIARDAETRLREVPDAIEVWGPSLRGAKEVRVEIDSERARAYGVRPSIVAEAVNLSFRGQRLRRFAASSGELEWCSDSRRTRSPVFPRSLSCRCRRLQGGRYLSGRWPMSRSRGRRSKSSASSERSPSSSPSSSTPRSRPRRARPVSPERCRGSCCPRGTRGAGAPGADSATTERRPCGSAC
ncbi:MAG: efflux RND transporter permease subunit [Acidobacteria bacterium]|nr:efflux RND transporter permease subunit [Acidobacteriota bacterium]